MEKVSVNGLSVSPDDGIGSPQRSNSVDSLKVESPGSSTRKGFGLKKWRRIKRDTPVKDEAATTPADDGSKLLKRNLTGLVNPPSKHVDMSSVEARQSSEGSVGSVNMAVHHHLLPGVVNGFSPPAPGFMFNVGQGFDKSEEHSGGGKIVSGSQGKGDTIKRGSEEDQERKPCSSIDSDLRSSDFVFSSEGQNGGKDEDGGDESHKKKNNSHYWADKDHIADSIRCLAALQEALWKEVTSFQELSKESIPPQLSNIDEVDSGSQALILKQKVKHLQHKLEEARADLDAKEAKIQELENSMIESELESVFQRKIEAEIIHLMLTSSLSASPQVLKPKKVHSVTEDPEPDRGNMMGKTCKFSFYFLTQLFLLLSILRLLFIQSSPASRLVIPT
ncbi:WPP domain-interacting protein 3 [Hirschfeldia incana]|nr:WPP domain-interacting protein 3 [Hirschfeldia incana]KAJ0242409.1 WPP domain-interacting protein 3 [Hirschfeldia incana]KAJ0242410.1 WPP domain-interacting protein 3 [Hirschfeldia incana]